MTREITPEHDWTTFFAGRDLPGFDVSAGRVVVLAAHPDDETLGVGGTVQLLQEAGAEVSVVVATDGEAAFPALDPSARAELGARRRDEMRAAMRELGDGDLEPVFLGLPDSGLAECEEQLTELLRELLSGADYVLVPWPHDPHPDHATVGRAGLAAAAGQAPHRA